MKTSEILELVRAGYTKEEIAQMDSDDVEKNDHLPDQKPEPEPEKKTEPTPEPKPEKKTEPTPEPTPEVKQESETDKLLKALGLKLDHMTAAIQKNNVNTLEQDGNTMLSTEDVIASIINPEYKGGNA